MQLLGEEEFVVVVPPGDPAGAGARVRPAALADREWVQYAPGNGVADLLDRACAAAGFQPRAAARVEQTAAAPSSAAAGLGPALVPANALPARFAGRLLRPDPPVRRELAVYARPADPVAAAFAEIARGKAVLVPAHVRRCLDRTTAA